MTVSPFLLLLLGLVGGLLSGALLVAWWYEGRTGQQEPQSGTEAPSSPAAERRSHLLTVDRTRGGELVVHLGGERLLTPEGLRADQRARLTDLVIALRAWVVETKSQPPSPPPPPVQPVPHDVPAATELPAPSAPAPLRSIALQIDDVLQEMLEDSPLKSRGISLSEGPDHSVIVWVGSTSYTSIDEVTDPDVRAVLRAAVEEWQRRHLSA